MLGSMFEWLHSPHYAVIHQFVRQLRERPSCGMSVRRRLYSSRSPRFYCGLPVLYDCANGIESAESAGQVDSEECLSR